MVRKSEPLYTLHMMGSRLMVGQQPLELFILGSNPSSPAEAYSVNTDRVL
jgi:hypothetical protein